MKTLLSLVFLAAAQPGHAATFQYIFNNVEQGAGGVSNPSIQVDGQGRSSKSSNFGNTSPTTVAEAAAEAGGEEASSSRSRFRLMAAQGRLTASRGSAWAETKRDFNDFYLGRSGLIPTLAATYFTGRDLGFTAFWLPSRVAGQALFGAEMEFIPVRVAVLGNTDFIETGILLGASTLGRQVLDKSGTLHAGLRASVNFHQQLGITAAVRSNFTDRRTYRYAQGEVGLAYRF